MRRTATSAARRDATKASFPRAHADPSLLVLAVRAPLGLALTTPAAVDTAHSIKAEGFAVVPEARVPASIVADVRSAVSTRLEELLALADAAGADVLEQQYSFNEICHRKRLRWDMRLPEDTANGAWRELTASAVEQAMPVLRELCDEATTRRSHGRRRRQPARRRAAVVPRRRRPRPLQHLRAARRRRAEADGTQYWPKSHLDPRAPDLALELKEGDAAMEEMVSPGCAAGGLICFDYTCVHRGRANGDRERPVAYIVVATSPDAVDKVNFPPTSVADAEPHVTETMPFWDDAASGASYATGGGATSTSVCWPMPAREGPRARRRRRGCGGAEASAADVRGGRRRRVEPLQQVTAVSKLLLEYM